MELIIENNSAYEIVEENLREALTRAEMALEVELKEMEVVQGTVNLLITDNEVMKHYNSKYRGKDEPTDVLSFAYLEGITTPGENEIIGDVIISAEKADVQSKERGVSFEDEMEFLFVHGILHLLGYDHDTEKNRKEMFQLTDQIMERALPPYHEG